MAAAVSGADSSLANKCFGFCKDLKSQGLAFSFSLTTGTNFSFSLDLREMAPHSVTKDKAWKKKSPSTIKRNARRREEFLKKKQSPAAVPARPLNILPSPTESSGRRQVLPLGRDPTAPSFTQLDGAATASPSPAPPAPDFPTLPPPEMTPLPALTTPLPSPKGKPQPARAAKTNPLICSDCGLSKKDHPGPTAWRSLFSSKVCDPYVTCLIYTQYSMSVL